jgi:hypothetical protein
VVGVGLSVVFALTGNPPIRAEDVSDWDHIEIIGGRAGASSAGGGSVSTWTCVDADTPLGNCTDSDGGQWNGLCYERVVATDPGQSILGQPAEQTAAIYAGHTGGVVVTCCPRIAGGAGTIGSACSLSWVPTAASVPSGAELAARARLIIEGRTVAPGIGVWPGDMAENNPDAMGVIGVPAWFWADHPGDGVGNVLTLSDSVAGYTLTATAQLDHIAYDLGDGAALSCGLGSVPVNRHEAAASPSGCDHTYTTPGVYTVHATTYVTVAWAGAGKRGSFGVQVDRSGTYRVGEIQVLAEGG